MNTDELRSRTSPPKATIFNDLQSNVTFSALGRLRSAGLGRRPGQSVYFEGTNIIVYIRGTEDDEVEWWKADGLRTNKSLKKGGVLVNAHYDRQAIPNLHFICCGWSFLCFECIYSHPRPMRGSCSSHDCILFFHVSKVVPAINTNYGWNPSMPLFTDLNELQRFYRIWSY